VHLIEGDLERQVLVSPRPSSAPHGNTAAAEIAALKATVAKDAVITAPQVRTTPRRSAAWW
jgi:hypothetical protein